MSDGCEGREERLVALLYEDGDPEELAETRAHLATCPACRAEFEELSSTRGVLAGWPDVANVPRVVYVPDPAGSGGRHAAERSRWAAFRPFLPSLAAAAAVVLVFLGSAPFLRVSVGPDGGLRLGVASSTAAAEASTLVTRGDLDRGLVQTAQYLEALMRTERQRDRQDVLSAVAQALSDQNTAVGDQVGRAINSAFDEAARRRQADLGVVLSSMEDLQVITQTELRQINAALASLAPSPSANQER